MATKGIWIPIEILQDEKLTTTEKLILSEINQLTSLEDGCYASNNHFAALANITRSNASRAITSLTKKGYIETEIVDGSRNHKRVIKLITPSIKTASPLVSKQQETKGNKQSNKQSNYKKFISELKMRCNIPSKVTCTKEGEKLFKNIDDVDKLIADYVNYQADKKEFAIRITAFMEDYNQANKTSDDWSKYAR